MKNPSGWCPSWSVLIGIMVVCGAWTEGAEGGRPGSFWVQDATSAGSTTANGPGLVPQVWEWTLELTTEERLAMEPELPRPPGAGPPAGEASSRAESAVERRGPPTVLGQPDSGTETPPTRDSVTNLLGTRFPWVEAELIWSVRPVPTSPGAEVRGIERPGTGEPEGGKLRDAASGSSQRYAKSRLRYDGDFTYLFAAQSPKRPMFLSLGGDLLELPPTVHTGISRNYRLHTMAFDPSGIREHLATHVYAGLGVPIPRIHHARVGIKVGQQRTDDLGVYAVLESVDETLLRRHRIAEDCVRIQLGGLQSLQYMGEDRAVYTSSLRPHRELSPAEFRRLIEFLNLISRSELSEFERRLPNFIQIESLLRYMVAITLTSNVTGFSNVGVNDYLCLDAKNGQFYFVASELETALGGAALSGTPQQLADLSIRQPYAGVCPLFERVMQVPEFSRQYQEILESSIDGPLAEVNLSAVIASLESAFQAARGSGEGGWPELTPTAGPSNTSGPPGAMSVEAFVQSRWASIKRQLAGADGYVPKIPDMGGMGRRQGAEQAIQPQQFVESVEVPAGFEATLYAVSPDVHYPVAIAAEPTGAIYVGIDPQGSLGTGDEGGRVVRCEDLDGDGVMDRQTVFCRVEHVRGVCYRGGKVWVSHPPFLSVFMDEDGDGQADSQQTLVTGLTTDLVETRGGDHTTNGVRMGIDGWLYIGDGDYGVPDAQGRDGSRVVLRGGGILRVRPDGTELELYASGLRNPFDLAIDPFMNLFTRDNTNDGGGWDTRVSHLLQSAEYGYPRLFANFSDEIMPTLGTFGGGGGTGGLYLEDSAWPASMNRILLTGDWGRSAVFQHPLTNLGPTFRLTQEPFISIPRATGMDLDALGNLYVASWWSGEASVYVGPHVGFVARVSPKAIESRTFPDLESSSLADLVEQLRSPQAVTRFHVQGELLTRLAEPGWEAELQRVTRDPKFPVAGRVAAVYALKQGLGNASHEHLLSLLEDRTLRAAVVRALTDRRRERDGVSLEWLGPMTEDPDPQVRAAAIVALGRLGNPAAVAWLLPVLGTLPIERPDSALPNPDAVLPHLAWQALVGLEPVEECLAELPGPHWRASLRVLRKLHRSDVVSGLIHALDSLTEPERRGEVLTSLIRLYHREKAYDGSWWGIRPDTSGPYYDPEKWSESDSIERVLRKAIEVAPSEERTRLLAELERHQIRWPDLMESAGLAMIEDVSIAIEPIDPNDPNQVGNLKYDEVVRRVAEIRGDIGKGKRWFETRSCNACHTSASGQTPLGPHLVDIGRRYQATELLESVLKPSEKIAQGYETQLVLLETGQVVSGFAIRESGAEIWLRSSDGKIHRIARDEIEERRRETRSAMPEGLVGSMKPEEVADLIAYLQSL